MAGIALVVALFGCGGGDDSGGGSGDGGSTATISKEEFVEEANAICNRVKKEGLTAMTTYLKEHQGSGKSKADQVLEAIHNAFLPALQKQVDDIRALGLPDGAEDEAEVFLVQTEKAIDTAEKSTGNAQFTQAFDKSADQARVLNINACVYGS